MQQRRFGRTGLTIPHITYGGGWVGGFIIRAGEAEREAVLDRALAAGIDWIDTAASYGQGRSEEVIGAWRAKRAERRQARISTKFVITDPAGDYEQQLRASLAASYQRLGMTQVPLVTLHNSIIADASAARRTPRDLTVSDMLRPGGALDTMDKLRREGLYDWVGITALGEPAALKAVVESGRVDAAQVYYNLLNPTADVPAGRGWTSTDFDGLLHTCKSRDVGVMGIRVLAAGVLATRERHGREISLTTNADAAAEEMRASVALTALGTDLGSGAEVAIRFALASDLMATIEVGIGEAHHLDVALAAYAKGPLPAHAATVMAPIWRAHPAFSRGTGGALNA